MATGKQESIICSLAYHLSLHLWQQNLTLLDFTPDFAKDFDYLQEVKIFYSGDGHTGMGWEKVGTWLWFFFPVLQYHHVVCPREGNKLCVPEGWSSLHGFSISCNKLLRNLQIRDPFQASSLSSTVLLCSQAGTCCATSEEWFPYPCKMSLGFLLFVCSMT